MDDYCEEVFKISETNTFMPACEVPKDLPSEVIPMVNGILQQEIEETHADAESNIDLKIAELQLHLDNKLYTFENDDVSPRINDALTDEEKIELKRVLGEYFSAANLAADKFLISQMDYDHFIPISIVAELELVKQITGNLTTQNKLDAIVKTLQEIPSLQLSEGNHKVRQTIPRSTLILREIHASTPVEEVKKLFLGGDCPQLLSCKHEHNNNWYVQFASEEDANRAYRYLRESGKMIGDKPVMARIKTKASQTGSFTAVNHPPAMAPVITEEPSPIIPMSCFASTYAYTFPEQTTPFFQPQFPLYPLYTPYTFGGFPPGVFAPVNYVYAAATDNQTTVELINARQRKPSTSRYGGSYHGRDGANQVTYNNEHKQPPRFHKKRAEGTFERDGANWNSASEELSNAATTSPGTSRVEMSSAAVGQLSPSSADSSKPTNCYIRYSQRRGSNRGRKNKGNHDGVKRTAGVEGMKPPSFELETSSFPPLSSAIGPAQAVELPLTSKPPNTCNQVQPAAGDSAIRIDQSNTIDASDLENVNGAGAIAIKESMEASVVRCSYAQIAKRRKEIPAKAELAESAAINSSSAGAATSSTTSATQAAENSRQPGSTSMNSRNKPETKIGRQESMKGKLNSKISSPTAATKEEAPKEWRNCRTRNRPQRTRMQEEEPTIVQQ